MKKSGPKGLFFIFPSLVTPIFISLSSSFPSKLANESHLVGVVVLLLLCLKLSFKLYII